MMTLLKEIPVSKNRVQTEITLLIVKLLMNLDVGKHLLKLNEPYITV